MHILAAVAQFERELIRERVAAGMKVAKAQGKAVGRPKRVFDREEVVRLRRGGSSIAEIARQTGLGHGTVVRVLQAAEDGAGPVQKASARIMNGTAGEKDLAQPPAPVQ
jgi:putative DNA-invertase from lambdoid prophage Rac